MHGNNKQINISGKQWLENTFDSNSWVILSPVEQSIRAKIEKYGTPLRDWDIKINRGVLTGCNEAFIITTAKREEILANCKTKDERKRTDEIIRPILRGRDIKRYKYDWKGLWLINTHNGVKGRFPRIDIKDYPAIKQWLDKGGEAYNGKIYHGYKDIEKRADKGDTPYNLRNCAYLEDFKQPKLLYREISTSMDAVYVNSDMFINNKAYLITGKKTKYLSIFFNSQFFTKIFLSAANTTGGKGPDFLLPLRIFNPPENIEKQLIVLAEKAEYEKAELLICQCYQLSEKEINYIL